VRRDNGVLGAGRVTVEVRVSAVTNADSLTSSSVASMLSSVYRFRFHGYGS
jgi:hypothetical protein